MYAERLAIGVYLGLLQMDSFLPKTGERPMSQFPNQFPSPQGYGPQGYGPQGYGPQGYRPPNNQGRGPMSAVTIIVIVAVIFFVGIAVCGILAGLLLPALQQARTATRRAMDSNNMKQIGLAFHNYESVYKALPAPVSMNSEKQKVWSWTVPLLPWVEEQVIYKQINFMDMKPWNSPENAMLQVPSPRCFTSSRARLEDECHVFVLSSPTRQNSGNPLFIQGSYTKFGEVSDGLGNTIMTIMLVKHGVPWASPTTLSIEEAFQFVQKEDDAVLVGMGDGSVTKIPSTIDKQTFTAMATRDGGEAVNIPRD